MRTKPMDMRLTPAQAYAENMPILHLTKAELLLTAATRLYMQTARGEETCGLDWHEGLITAGVRPCAVVAFGVLLDALTN
jgi:hypothetical protein